ncbi:hypothetical protein WLX12_22530, partial [Bordetella bronchiseptica]
MTAIFSGASSDGAAMDVKAAAAKSPRGPAPRAAAPPPTCGVSGGRGRDSRTQARAPAVGYTLLMGAIN